MTILAIVLIVLALLGGGYGIYRAAKVEETLSDVKCAIVDCRYHGR